MTLDELNGLADSAFVRALAAIYEHSPWVAADVAGLRPFASIDELHGAMMEVVAMAPEETRFALVAGHPDLGGRLARAGKLEAASAAEQSGLGLDRLSEAEFARFDRLNTEYRARFGFPFVIAVKRHTRATILAAFEQRLSHDTATELRTALNEVNQIARFRLEALIAAPAAAAGKS